jgi:hypothetical protein
MAALAGAVSDHAAAVHSLDTRMSDAHGRLAADVAALTAKVDEALTLLRGTTAEHRVSRVSS